MTLTDRQRTVLSVRPAADSFPATTSHLIDGDEVYGLLNGIQQIDDETVRAQIGQKGVLLPAGLKLPIGRRVFVARLDNEYHVWEVPA